MEGNYSVALKECFDFHSYYWALELLRNPQQFFTRKVWSDHFHGLGFFSGLNSRLRCGVNVLFHWKMRFDKSQGSNQGYFETLAPACRMLRVVPLHKLQ